MIKLISAAGGLTMQPGVEKTLIDMIVEASEGFSLMVGKGFPRVEKKVLQPVHACMGIMEITGGGIICLTQADVGTTQVFYDVDRAEQTRLLRPKPKDLGRERVRDIDRVADRGPARQQGGLGQVSLASYDVVGKRRGEEGHRACTEEGGGGPR